MRLALGHTRKRVWLKSRGGADAGGDKPRPYARFAGAMGGDKYALYESQMRGWGNSLMIFKNPMPILPLFQKRTR